MESQTGDLRTGGDTNAMSENLERMAERMEAAASLLERTVTQLEERESARTGEVQKMVATVDASRESELQKKLEAAEQQIAEMRAQMEAQVETRGETRIEAQARSARKTVPAVTAQLLAKQGISTLETVEAGALDAALSGLSLEQRIAVKAQLLRAGVVG
jgi:ABC-type Fe3+-citrate transport system substrate-binding protein